MKLFLEFLLAIGCVALVLSLLIFALVKVSGAKVRSCTVAYARSLMDHGRRKEAAVSLARGFYLFSIAEYVESPEGTQQQLDDFRARLEILQRLVNGNLRALDWLAELRATINVAESESSREVAVRGAVAMKVKHDLSAAARKLIAVINSRAADGR